MDRVGNTTEGFLQALSLGATVLSQIGQPTSDIIKLLQFELLQASAAQPKTYLTGSTDLGLSSPGLDLVLTRFYNGTLLGRGTAGEFGDGWIFSFDISAVTDASGNVYIKSAGGMQFFSRQPDGRFTSSLGDNSTLSVSNGSYVLTGIGGSATHFLADGRLGSIADRNGNSITANWDSAGQLQSVRQSDGQSISFTYNAFGRIASATDSNGQQAIYDYDASGEHLLRVTTVRGVTRYEYIGGTGSPRDNALAKIDYADGTHHFFEYDTAARLTAEYGDAGSGRVDYAYDGAGRVVITDALGNSTSLFYDTAGNFAQTQDSLGRPTRLSYDGTGNLTGLVTGGNSIFGYSSDALGNLTAYTDPLGGKIAISYEPGTPRLTALTDQLGNPMQYTYDSAGNLGSIVYADGSGTRYTYSSNGLLSSTTNARGQTQTLSYNATGQLIRKDFPDGSFERYGYDSHQNMTSASARDGGVTTYNYDSADRLISQTDANGRTVGYAYDSGGRLIARRDPDGTVTTFDYDAAGRLWELRDGAGRLLVRYGYDVAGRLAHTDHGNGATTNFTYNTAGELNRIVNYAGDGRTIGDITYAYDADSRVTSASSLDGNWVYSYDAAGQLTHAVFDSTNAAIADQDLAYVYDAAGNRIQAIENGVVANYVTNGLNQYVSVGGATYTYDPDGNLTAKTEGANHWNYSYDEEKHLVAVNGPDGNWTYGYDALGHRVTMLHDGVRQDYVNDPLTLSVAQQYDGSGNLLATNIYGLGLAARSLGTLGMQYANADLTGNVTGLTGVNGELAGSYVYRPFGQVISDTGAFDNPFRFSGGLGVMSSDSTGLDFAAGRLYDASLGRSISRVSVGMSAGGASTQGLVSPSQTLAEETLTFVENVNDSPLVPFGLAVVTAHGSINQFADRWESFKTASDLIGAGVNLAQPNSGFIAFENAWSNYYEALGNGDIDAAIFYRQQIGHTAHGAAKDIGNLWTGLITSFGFSWSSFATVSRFLYDLASTADNAIEGETPILRSLDPNDLVGPFGFGPEKFVASGTKQPYTIDFENIAGATAPAQHIVITQQLDPDLDPRTFRLTGFGFDNQRFDLPGDKPFYNQRLDLTSTKGYFVDVSAGVDISTGIVTWTFDTIDPATGEATQDASVGLLPVNDSTGRGDGFVSYTVKARSIARTGDVIDAQARIVFDTEEPIDTPAIFNTLDVGLPSSAVDALPVTTDQFEIPLSWSGTDDAGGSAVASYSIFVSDNGGSFTPFLSDTTLTQSVFTGQLGHHYVFYSVARDNVGNAEAASATPDASITIPAPANARIGGLVFEDRNGSGTRESGEGFLAGWNAFLDTNLDGVRGDGEAFVVTGVEGTYSFDGLTAGTYRVAEEAQAGWVRTTPGGTGHDITLAAGEIADGRDFGNRNLPPVTQADSYFLDEDGVLSVPLGLGVLANDSDIDTLTAQLLTGPAHGVLDLHGDGGFGYTPAQDYFGDDTFTYLAQDTHGNVTQAQVTLHVARINDPPTLDTIADRGVYEGETVTVAMDAQDVDLGDQFAFSIDSAPTGASIDSVTGVFTWRAADGPGDVGVTVRVTDDGGQFATRSFNIAVADVAPTLAIAGAAVGVEGALYALQLSASDPGDDTISGWTIHWGDGVYQVVAGNPASVSHAFGVGNFTVEASATNEDGVFLANSVAVSIARAPLQIIDFIALDTGFAARFNQALDVHSLNLYDGQNAGLGAADITLTGASAGAVKGTLVVDADALGFRFIKTGGLLLPDSYTATLASGSKALHDAVGNLDGDKDGVAGGNAVHSFTMVAPEPGTATISIPDVVRGPGQAVNLPAIGSGIPIRITNGAGSSSVAFTLTYDPALLSLAGVVGAAGLPGGVSVAADTTTPGSVRVSINGLAGLTNAATGLVNVLSSVPVNAPYGSKQVLDLRDLLINAGAKPALGDDGVQIIGFIGDTTGNAAYSSLDVQRIQRLMVGLDTGFSAWQNADPLLIADVNANGALSSLDAARLLQEVNFLFTGNAANDRPEVPAIPPGILPIVAGGPDPTVSIPTDLKAKPGDIVTVPVRIVDTAAGLESVQLSIVFDADKLEIVDVRKGGLTGDFQWYIEKREAGMLKVDMSRLTGLDGGLGNILEIDVRVKAAATGQVPIDLQSLSLNEGRLTLSQEPRPGPDPTDGAILLPRPIPFVLQRALAVRANVAPLIASGGEDEFYGLRLAGAAFGVRDSARLASQSGVDSAFVPIIDMNRRAVWPATGPSDRMPSGNMIDKSGTRESIAALLRSESKSPNNFKVFIPVASTLTPKLSTL